MIFFDLHDSPNSGFPGVRDFHVRNLLLWWRAVFQIQNFLISYFEDFHPRDFFSSSRCRSRLVSLNGCKINSRETLCLDQLLGFSFSASNLFLHPFLKSKFMKKILERQNNLIFDDRFHQKFTGNSIFNISILSWYW